jgi:hypothetical protein
MLRFRTQLGPGQFFGARAQIVADIVPVDDKVGAMVIDAAHQQMDMRVVGVPVIDRDPFEPGAEIGFHLANEIAGIFAKVRQVRRILGRDDDPEMMPVVLAPIGEGAIVGAIAIGVEHPRGRSVAGDALALEIGDVRGQRRPRPSIPVETGDRDNLDQHAPARSEQAAACEGRAATAEVRLPALARSAPAGRSPASAAARGDAEHLDDKSLRLAALAGSPVPDLARPDAEILVLAHGRAAFRRKWPIVPFGALILLAFSSERHARRPTYPRQIVERHRLSANLGRAFYLAVPSFGFFLPFQALPPSNRAI